MASGFDRTCDVIRQRIAEGDLTEGLEQIRDLTSNAPRPLADEALLLSGRYARLVRDERRGTVTADRLTSETNRITASALGLLDELERQLPPSATPLTRKIDSNEQVELSAGIPFEKILGTNNLKQIAWLEQGVRVSRGVCRILTPAGLGTGFLVGPTLLMTNNHVIPSVEAGRTATIEFNYQVPFGEQREPAGAVRYELAPEIAFRTDTQLDYTIVAIDTKEVSGKPEVGSWGVLPLNPNADPVRDEHVVIVQHPNGGAKQIVLTANAVLQVQAPLLMYSTDTMPGSSGSPVFNDLWEVIALHHAAGPSVKVGSGFRYSNEGILMSAIKADLGSDWPQ